MRIIENVKTSDLAEIVAGLVREGVTFQVLPNLPGSWNITLLGGY